MNVSKYQLKEVVKDLLTEIQDKKCPIKIKYNTKIQFKCIL